MSQHYWQVVLLRDFAMQSLYSFRKPPVNRTMGIEIECFYNGDFERQLYYGFFYAGQDGSIDCNWGQTGVEWVSQPLTKEWLKKEIDKLWFKYPGWKWNDTCGIHIHVSRKWLSDKKAKAIYKFLQNQSDVFFREIFGRSSNYYCRTTESYGSTRYCTINSENTATIEFRMFRSGDANWAKYCVDCVEYMIQSAYHLSTDGCYAFRDLYKL